MTTHATDDDPIRADRLASLGVLLTRIVNGLTLTADEAKLLVAHIDVEVRESTTARTLARRTPASIAPAASAHPLVKGRCPACNGSSLFLGDGGYVTCARLDCPNPTLADDQLHKGRTTPSGTLTAQLHALIETEVYEYRERTMHWPEGGITTEIARLATRGALEAITAQLEFGPEDAWCKTCRRVWSSNAHRCEGDAEQRLAHVRDLRDRWLLMTLEPGQVRRLLDELTAALSKEPTP